MWSIRKLHGGQRGVGVVVGVHACVRVHECACMQREGVGGNG